MNEYDKEKARSDFRVGLITLTAALLVVIGITFAGGDKGLLFGSRARLTALLADVNGLKKGSAVAMRGMTIGKVTAIDFLDGSGSEVEVTLLVRGDARSRVKSDSVPAVRTQGMMGDRYVDITPGSPDSPVLPSGQPLKGPKLSDFDATLSQASEVLSESEKLLTAVNEQRGTLGQFIYDEKFYRNVTAITGEVEDLIKDFKKNPRKYIKFSLF